MTRSGASSRSAAASVFVHTAGTIGAADPRTDSVLILDGRIMAAGPLGEIGALADHFDVPVLDLSGHTVLPGFLDAHNHQPSAARDRGTVPTAHVSSVPELVAAVADAALGVPAGAWLSTERSLTRAQLQERRYVRMDELSAAAPNHPVAVRFGAHSMVLNELAMRRTGLWEADPVGASGVVDRAGDGTPTGAIHEYGVMRLVERELPPEGGQVKALEATQRAYLQAGLTGIRVPGLRRGELAWYQELQREGRLHHRVHGCIRLDPNGAIDDHLAELDRYEAVTGFGDDWLSLDAIKLFVDGGVGRSDAPTVRFLDRDRFERTALEAASRGWSVTCHAVSKEAIVDALAAYREVRASLGPQPRLAIEHAFEADPSHVAAAVRNQVALSLQPALVELNMHLLGPDGPAPVDVGAALAAGADVVLGSDWNATPGTHVRPYAPLRTIGSLLREGVAIAEAVAAHSAACGRLLGRPRLGRIDAGAVGDLIAIPGTIEQVAAGVREGTCERPSHVIVAGRLSVEHGEFTNATEGDTDG